MGVSRVPLMRPQRLLIPLALLTPPALAAPAMAADIGVSVTDYEYTAKEVKIAPGDTVTWSFDAGFHTSTSDSGQAEAWDSGPATSPPGTTYQKAFTRPGRFTYYCIPHESFPMRGTVVVGSDEFPKSQSKFKLVRKGKKITVSFTLVESAKVVAKLKGPSDKKATRKRLAPGRYSIPFKKLKRGKYTSTVTFTDDFDKVTKVKKTAVVR